PSGAQCRAIAAACEFLSLLDLDEEGLEFWGLRVAVADDGRERVGEKPGLRKAGKPPVNGNAHVMHHLAICLERSEALGDDRHGLDVATVGADAHPVARLDAD